jgi:hypothetical protein
LSPAFIGNLLDKLGSGGSCAAFLRRRISEPRPQLAACTDKGLCALFADVCEQFGHGGKEGDLFQHAVWLLAAFPPLDDAAFRVGCLSRVAGNLKGLGVQHRKVTGLVNDQDRYVGRYRIQLVSRRVTKFGQLGVVVAEPDNEVGLADIFPVGLDPVFERLLDRRYVGIRPIRGRQHVGPEGLKSTHHDMAMSIDEAGQHGAPAKVDHLGLGTLVLHHLFRRADRNDPARLFCDCFSPHGSDRSP